jgi:hypothetical protein
LFYSGSWTCRSALPRFVANGDGTVTDNRTGLMWEATTSTCSGEVTCYSNTYTWTGGSPGTYGGMYPSGSLFTIFIGQLNGGDYYNPTVAGQPVGLIVNPTHQCDPFGTAECGVPPCFANHCDWRVPTYAELESIYVVNPVCGSLPGYPCIDTTIFGVTPASIYWSFSTDSTPESETGNPPTYEEALCVSFDFRGGCIDYKTSPHYARAVRTTR